MNPALTGDAARDHPVAVGRLLYVAGCSEEVVAAGRGVWAQPRAGGDDMREQVAIVFSFRNGLVASVRAYTDLSAAQRATRQRSD